MAKKTDEEVRLEAAVVQAETVTEANEKARKEVEEIIAKAQARKMELEEQYREASEKLRVARRAHGRFMPLKGKALAILTKAATTEGYTYHYDEKSNGPLSAYGISYHLRNLGYVTLLPHRVVKATAEGVAKLKAQGVIP